MYVNLLIDSFSFHLFMVKQSHTCDLIHLRYFVKFRMKIEFE